MSKYLPLLKYEASAIARDPINLYMCLFPVIMLLLSSFVFPMIFESIDPAQEIALEGNNALAACGDTGLWDVFLLLWPLSFWLSKRMNTR